MEFKVNATNVGLVVTGVLGLVNLPALAFVALIATGVLGFLGL